METQTHDGHTATTSRARIRPYLALLRRRAHRRPTAWVATSHPATDSASVYFRW